MGCNIMHAERHHHDPDHLFVGIASGTLPEGSIENSAWKIWPVRSRQAQEQDATEATRYTLELPASAMRSQSWIQGLASLSRIGRTVDTAGYEVNIVIVQPLQLDTIYVAVDGDALKKHDEVQKRFGGGFVGGKVNGYAGKGRKEAKAICNGRPNGADDRPITISQDNQLTIAIRQALTRSMLVRQGDLLPLPLPAHPITHVSFPPAQIMLCEPTGQGLLAPSTKIVVNRTYQIANAEPPSDTPLPILSSSKSLTDFDITDGDGSSHEAFHSAMEEGDSSDSDIQQVASSGSDESIEEPGESSDDSGDDMIMMKTPSLAARLSGIASSKTAATPQATKRTNSVHTPGSVLSNMTSGTARQAQINGGKCFRAIGLTDKISGDVLHPKPTADEDEECRVFVDLKVLVRLGCFSGDWVQLKPEDEHNSQGLSLTSVLTGPSKEYRPVKIYGLPDLSAASTVSSIGSKPRTRRSSLQMTIALVNSTLNAWLSPILLANLGQPKSVRIRPLLDLSPETPVSRSKASKSKMNPKSFPPIAREMTMVKVPTPLSTEMSVQAGMFLALKRYFEVKRRVLQSGDLIAISFDANASRLLHQPSHTEETEDEKLELMDLSLNKSRGQIDPSDIVWFKVSSIAFPEPLEAADIQQDCWSNAATIEMKTTRMLQTGIEPSNIPASSVSTWEYYLGLRQNGGGYPSSQWISTRPVTKSFVTDLQRRLGELMAAATSPRAVHLGLDPIIILLHSSQRKVGKASLATRAASNQGIHTFSIDAYDLLAQGSGNGDVKSEGLLESRIERALSCGASFTSILLRHVEALTAERMITAIKKHVTNVRVLIATTTELDMVSEGVRSVFTHEFEVAAPDEDERRGLLQDIIQEHGLWIANDVDLAAVAVKTAALVAGNLVDIVERAVVAKKDRLDRLLSSHRLPDPILGDYTVQDVLIAGGEAVCCLTKVDFDIAVEAARKNFADAIGAPKIPNVSWDDVGGLENVKDAVMETIQLPLERPELFAKGMKKRSGILFYGPPGTGKTLLAKAIATEFSLNFFSVKGPELLNMYIGESEANVRRVFQRARDARPCVVFFDELDSVAPKRGNQGDSGGVMDRIVSQLLAELDGMNDGEESSGGVFVIGATNRPDLLDQALLRPGRFDKMLYLGMCDTHDSQVTILEALTRKFKMHPDLSLHQVATLLPLTYTGADLYALCSDAMLKAITRQASAVDAKIKSLPGGPVTTAYFFDHLAQEDDIAVMVTEDDFAAARRELVPSVR